MLDVSGVKKSMEIIHSLFFYAIAGVIILSALGVVFMPKIIYSALSMVIGFIAIAGLFILLNADFVGISQVMIYAVGITIIIIFAIMLTGEKHERKLWIAFAPRAILSMGFAFALFLIISAAVTANFTHLSENTGIFSIQTPPPQTIETLKSEGTAKLIGNGIFTRYVLPFELLSLLLLAVILGAAVIAKKDSELLLNPTTEPTTAQTTVIDEADKEEAGNSCTYKASNNDGVS